MIHFILAAGGGSTVPFTVGGSVGIGGLAIYLLRELRKSSGGVWKIVRDKNKTIHRNEWELRVGAYQKALLENQLLKCRGLVEQTQPPDIDNPGPYVQPTEEELRTW